MTKKEMENAMSFIVEQQAQFAINQQQFALNQEQVERRVSRLEGAIVTVISMIGELTKAQKHTEEKLNELIEAQAHTDERLNIFINVVERHISEGLNGNSR